MAQQFAVIGLGTFGTAIARELARNGGEVVAIDRDMEPVERIKDEVAYAIQLDATDPKVLEAHDIHKVDVAIVAIGHDFEATVLIAVELMQLGLKRLMTRAEGEIQKRILQRLGVPEILCPEEEVAKHVAQRLLNPGIIDLFRLSDDYSIVEVQVPERFVGKTLAELKIRERFRCNVIAIKRPQEQQEKLYAFDFPDPEARIEAGEIWLVLGLPKEIERMTA